MDTLINEIAELDTSDNQLMKFGLLVGSVLIVLGISPWDSGIYHRSLMQAGGLLFFLAVLFPKLLRILYILWMLFAFLMGMIMSGVILVVVFLVMFTAIRLVSLLAGKEFLNLRWGDDRETMWIKREGVADYKKTLIRQF